jgi:type IV pilus assembly protein PilV
MQMMNTDRSRDLKASTRRHPARGFALIEVLVSLLIFSLGILGMVGLQARATRFSVDASERTRASIMASELVATMWAAQSTTPNAADLTAWVARLKDPTVAGLPQADYSISAPDADGAVAITLTWKSVSRGAQGATGTYVTTVAIPGGTP